VTKSRQRTKIDDSAKVEAAISAVYLAAVKLVLKRGQTKDEVFAGQRAQTEILEMAARLRREVAASGKGWTWHLLTVLDWDGHDVAQNEAEGVRLRLTDETKKLDHAAIDRKWKAQITRLRAAVAAYKAALPDLLWSAQCFEGGPPIQFPDDIENGLENLERALAWHEQRTATWKLVKGIHGKVRRYDHVRAAALRILIHVHELGGRDEKSRLAKFIMDANDRTPRPCPRFVDAGDGAGAYDNVRKILNHTGL